MWEFSEISQFVGHFEYFINERDYISKWQPHRRIDYNALNPHCSFLFNVDHVDVQVCNHVGIRNYLTRVSNND